jgi:hypothetical protein
MNFLTQAFEQSFESIDSGVLNLKIVKSDRSGYTPNF